MEFVKPKEITITSAMLASSGQRLGNYLIDMVIHNIINVIPIGIGWILYEFFGKQLFKIYYFNLFSQLILKK